MALAMCLLTIRWRYLLHTGPLTVTYMHTCSSDSSVGQISAIISNFPIATQILSAIMNQREGK